MTEWIQSATAAAQAPSPLAWPEPLQATAYLWATQNTARCSKSEALGIKHNSQSRSQRACAAIQIRSTLVTGVRGVF